jgi:hypothetical protein
MKVEERTRGDVMKKETLDKARKIEHQIEQYNEIVHAMTFPWQRFKLWRKRSYIGAAGYNNNTEVTLADPELAKLIEDYCREKIKKLNKELEEL